ncbi:MAG: nitrite/sulfite reductase [Alphaproteobacteria bacterium]|jgi:sulfite reductase (NADPH) hemoprotein beta-component|nr:nitrite/sulfite reductase [Alphaproteobacteria bacterium]MDP6817077.1 nitrite/sulfite reductase [Alphaproteobacteria bacterium]
MYRYDEFDHAFVQQRVAQFRDQVARRLTGELSEDAFKPLRLMNGLYLQLHAYMLRVAIPYGTLSSRQMRRLSDIARRYDKGYGHITTRQNIQFNWSKLSEVPDILAALAEVEMHAIQTSGNCIRNVTADHFAGAAADEIEDPRPWCEIIRQWSTLHPEFSFLPRKFKIAVSGAAEDRAALRVHDIGLRICLNEAGKVGFEVMVGGGQGRTPMIAKTIREFLPKAELLSYLESILRVYNQLGRRDNMYKARIKILVHEIGAEALAEMIEAEWRQVRQGFVDLAGEEVARIERYFAPPPFEPAAGSDSGLDKARRADSIFDRWLEQNVDAHKQPGYAIVTVSLKSVGRVPGDIDADRMEAVADLAMRFSFDELRATHQQNLVLPHVRKCDLHAVWQKLEAHGLATANRGLIGDIIACPGMDYCSLATARSIPVARAISERFDDLARQNDIGDLRLNISGCINACGHHHVGHIGILGLEKNGAENYQITLGGRADGKAAIGEIVGPAFSAEDIVGAVEAVVHTYLDLRRTGERFIDAYARLGRGPFKENIYAAD